MSHSHLNPLAKRLRSLHVPGNPLVLTNIYSPDSATIVASIPATKALATASYAVAAVSGTADASLTLSENLRAIGPIGEIAIKHSLPLTVDLQDGYEDLAESVKRVIEKGVVGANIEDLQRDTGGVRKLDVAVERIKLALRTAEGLGVPDFCVNARSDILGTEGGTISNAIERGKAFLEAGATTVFIWGGGGGRGLRDHEIKELVKAFGGKLSVMMSLKDGMLNAGDLADMGVARISIGPGLYFKETGGAGVMEAVEEILAKRKKA